MTRFDPAVQDFQWLLERLVDWRPGDPARGELELDTARQLVAAAGDLIADIVAPLNAASDRVGATLQDGRVRTAPGWPAAYRRWCAGGWPGIGAGKAYGGQEAPFLAQACVAAMLGGADLAFAMIAASARSAASVLAAHAEEPVRALCLERLASGEWTATIAITEPQAGSDLGLIATRAAHRPGGRFALDGSKIFISGGDHDLSEQILHLVLARIEGASAGVKGLSLFLVPSVRFDDQGRLGERNGVAVTRLEEKLGLHGSPTCAVSLEDAEGRLIGAEGAGLACLFTMMAELRLEVALSAVGIAGSATAFAIDYAQSRRQGRAPGPGPAPSPLIDHPDVRRMTLIMRALTEAGRALVVTVAQEIDQSRSAEEPARRQRAALRVALLLPVCKAALSEDVVAIADLGVQLRGGHGYVRESGAEQFLRDSRVLALYEGANGVQAVDLVMRKLRRDQGAALAELTAEIEGDLERLADRPELLAIREVAQAGLHRLGRASARLLLAPEADEVAVLSGASAYLSLFGRVLLAWMWLRMAAAEGSDDDPVLAEKRDLAEFYARYFGPELALHEARALRDLPPAAPQAEPSRFKASQGVHP